MATTNKYDMQEQEKQNEKIKNLERELKKYKNKLMEKYISSRTDLTRAINVRDFYKDKYEELKKENNKLKKENKILIERMDNAQNILEDENFLQCIDCCLYYDSDGLEFGENGSGIRCRECDIKLNK